MINSAKSEPVPAGKFLLNTMVASNDQYLEDKTSISSKFNFYEIVFDNLGPSKSEGHLRMQYKIGHIFAEDPYYTVEGYGNDSNGNRAFTAKGTSFHVWDTERSGPSNAGRQGPVTPTGLFGKLTIYNPLQADTYKSYLAELYGPWTHEGHGCIMLSGGGYLRNQEAVTGFRLFFDNGNVNSGTVKVYGWM